MEPALRTLVPMFERASGTRVIVAYAPTAPIISQRLHGGERPDVVIATRKGIAALVREGKIAGSSTAAIARVYVGAFVRRGAAKPDISTMDAFRKVLLEARAIAHSNPARGGRTARYIAGLLARLDIADAIKPKIKIFAPGEFGKVLEDGEIGFALSTEIKARPGVELIGYLPAGIGYHTDFAAGVTARSKAGDAAQALVRFFRTPAGKRVLASKGFEPL